MVYKKAKDGRFDYGAPQRAKVVFKAQRLAKESPRYPIRVGSRNRFQVPAGIKLRLA